MIPNWEMLALHQQTSGTLFFLNIPNTNVKKKTLSLQLKIKRYIIIFRLLSLGVVSADLALRLNTKHSCKIHAIKYAIMF